MKKFVTSSTPVAMLLALGSYVCNAADVDVTVQVHQATTAPLSARYEILQSPLAARWTFKIDRFAGRVWQMIRTKDDDVTWEEMRVIERPIVSSPSKPRFQFFTSGLAARHTFLIDGDTGRTWLIVSGKRKESDGNETEYTLWQPFAK